MYTARCSTAGGDSADVAVDSSQASAASASVPVPVLVSRVEPLTTPERVPVFVAATSTVPPPPASLLYFHPTGEHSPFKSRGVVPSHLPTS